MFQLQNILYLSKIGHVLKRSIMLGEKIKLLRENLSISQRELGAYIEVDAAFISKIEKGEKSINRKHLVIISQVLKTTESELLTLWLADKVYKVIAEEELGLDALTIAEKKMDYNKSTQHEKD